MAVLDFQLTLQIGLILLLLGSTLGLGILLGHSWANIHTWQGDYEIELSDGSKLNVHGNSYLNPSLAVKGLILPLIPGFLDPVIAARSGTLEIETSLVYELGRYLVTFPTHPNLTGAMLPTPSLQISIFYTKDKDRHYHVTRTDTIIWI